MTLLWLTITSHIVSEETATFTRTSHQDAATRNETTVYDWPYGFIKDEPLPTPIHSVFVPEIGQYILRSGPLASAGASNSSVIYANGDYSSVVKYDYYIGRFVNFEYEFSVALPRFSATSTTIEYVSYVDTVDLRPGSPQGGSWESIQSSTMNTWFYGVRIGQYDVQLEGIYNTFDLAAPDAKVPSLIRAKPTSYNPYQFESPHIDYTKGPDNKVLFTDEKWSAFKDVGEDFILNLVTAAVSSVVINQLLKRVPTVALGFAAFDLLFPLIKVSYQAFGHAVGLNAEAPTNRQISEAIDQVETNLKLSIIEFVTAAIGPVGEEAINVLTNAIVSTATAIHYKETDSFTYSYFEPDPDHPGVSIVGGDRRDFAIGSVFADEIHGMAGADQLYGSDGDDALFGEGDTDALYGGNGADFLDGGTGDDILIGGAGNDELDGGSGTDIAIFAAASSQVLLTRTGAGVWTAVGPDGSDTLRNIETVRFADGDVELPSASTPRDYNGDGRSDVLFRNLDGSVAQWQMNGTTIAVNAVLSSNPGTGWKTAGIGDFNGDGKSDVLFRHDDGRVAQWQMNGTTIAVNSVLGSNPGASWKIAGVGDFDGDGKADVLWRPDCEDAALHRSYGFRDCALRPECLIVPHCRLRPWASATESRRAPAHRRDGADLALLSV